MFDQGLHGGGNDPLAGSSVFESVANNETSEVLMNAADRLSGADRSTRAWGGTRGCVRNVVFRITNHDLDGSEKNDYKRRNSKRKGLNNKISNSRS